MDIFPVSSSSDNWIITMQRERDVSLFPEMSLIQIKHTARLNEGESSVAAFVVVFLELSIYTKG